MPSPLRFGAAHLPATPTIVNLAAAQRMPVHWLWEPWLPTGNLCLLDGDPGLGKSTLTLDLTARLTRGDPMPDAVPGSLAAPPGDVLILSAEDDLERTILPRLEAAQADLRRVHFLQEVTDAGGARPPLLPYDLISLLPSLPPLRLIVIDPFIAFIGPEFDVCKDQQIRRCLHTLARLAQESQATILLVRHLNKSAGPKALYRGLGAIGITGAARAALVVGRPAESPHAPVLAMVKCNLAPSPASLAYELEQIDGACRIRWLGMSCWKADDLLARPPATDPVADCAAFMRQLLGDGPLPSAKLEALCAGRGWSRSMYKRARKEAGLQSNKNGANGTWMSDLSPLLGGGNDWQELLGEA